MSLAGSSIAETPVTGHSRRIGFSQTTNGVNGRAVNSPGSVILHKNRRALPAPAASPSTRQQLEPHCAKEAAEELQCSNAVDASMVTTVKRRSDTCDPEAEGHCRTIERDAGHEIGAEECRVGDEQATPSNAQKCLPNVGGAERMDMGRESQEQDGTERVRIAAENGMLPNETNVDILNAVGKSFVQRQLGSMQTYSSFSHKEESRGKSEASYIMELELELDEFRRRCGELEAELLEQQASL